MTFSELKEDLRKYTCEKTYEYLRSNNVELTYKDEAFEKGKIGAAAMVEAARLRVANCEGLRRYIREFWGF